MPAIARIPTQRIKPCVENGRPSRTCAASQPTSAAIRMARPPIVGVPCLAMWCSGPRSSLPRIGWPSPRVRNAEINARVANSATTPATAPAIMIAIIGRGPPARGGRRRGRRRRRRWSPIVCVVSWPLPAMITRSPGSAMAMAWRMASARSSCYVDAGRGQPSATPARMSSAMASGGLRAGVVARHHHDVGEPGRDGAHQWSLLTVAVAAGAEHHDHPAVGADDRTAGGDHLLEPVGRVGVIDDHVDRGRALSAPAAAVTRSKRPGTGSAAASPATIVVERDRQCGGRGGSRERVHHVERSADRRRQPRLAGDERRAPREPHIGGADVDIGGVADRERHDLDRRRVGQPPAVAVVDVHHADTARPGSKSIALALK